MVCAFHFHFSVSDRRGVVCTVLFQEIAHDLASALYRLLSKKDPVLKAGAFRVAEAVLAPEKSAPRDPQSPAASTVAVVPASGRRRDYRGVFARHGVTKLVSLVKCGGGGDGEEEEEE